MNKMRKEFVTSHNPQARLKSIGCAGAKTVRLIFNTRKLLIFTFQKAKK